MSMRNPFGGDAAAGKGFAALGGLAKGLGAKRGKSRNTHFNEAVEAHKQKTVIDTVAAMQLREHESNMNIKEAKAASKEGRKSGAPVQYESNYAKMAVGKPEPKASKQSEGVSPTPSEKMAASDTSPKPMKAPAEKPKPTGAMQEDKPKTPNSLFNMEGAKEKGFQSTSKASKIPNPLGPQEYDLKKKETAYLAERQKDSRLKTRVKKGGSLIATDGDTNMEPPKAPRAATKKTSTAAKAPKPTAKKPNSAPTTTTSKAGPNTNKPSSGTPKAKTQPKKAAAAKKQAKGAK